MFEKMECAICGKEFIPTTERQFLCSEECGLAYSNQWARGIEVTQRCKKCGRKFTSWGHKVYCSKECRDAVAVKHSKSRPKMTRLDEILKYCKEQGITYAEYQMRNTQNYNK